MENILQNADRIKGRQGEKIAEWGDKLLLAKRLTTICLDVPIDFREEDLTVCAPRIDELKALFAELDFRIFLNDLTNLAPAEPLPEGPVRRPRPSWRRWRVRSPQPLKKLRWRGREICSPPQPILGIPGIRPGIGAVR